MRRLGFGGPAAHLGDRARRSAACRSVLLLAAGCSAALAGAAASQIDSPSALPVAAAAPAPQAVTIRGSSGQTSGTFSSAPNHGRPLPDPGGRGRRAVFLEWRAPDDGQVVFDTAGGHHGASLTVYDRSVAAGDEVARSGDVSSRRTTSRVAFTALGGETYLIAVGASVGGYALRWAMATPMPPDTTITAGPSGTIGFSSVGFEFTSTAAGATFRCSLDRAPFTACSSPPVYAGLCDGVHSFAVEAVDAHGSTDPTPAVAVWTQVAGGCQRHGVKLRGTPGRSRPSRTA